VTSLDIIHSFWAYQLGVKADANPGVDNIFHVTPQKTGGFEVRCSELCGLWHGNMADSGGQVVSQSDFDTWIAQQQADFATIAKVVPSYAPYYFPLPLTKGS
jgi:cytochrome c oxidase subunit 2